MVTAQRVIVLDGPQVRALDTRGRDAWTAPWEGFSPDARTSPNYPVVRLVSPDVVAVVDVGRGQGQGLDQDAYAAKITMLRVQDGSLVKAVTIPGSPTDAPVLGKVGLGFFVPGANPTAVGVLPNGQVVNGPSPPGKAVVGAATVGSTVLTLTGTTPEAPEGIAGPGWGSNSVAPSPAHSLVSVEASDADRLVLLRFAIPNGASMQRVIDVSTGKVLASPSCASNGIATMTSSPGRGWRVIGPMRLDREGNVQCFGGGDGQKRVVLTAVADDGRAFGTASQGGSETLFVSVAPNGEVTTAALSNGVAPPIGVMEGGLAIHWDPNTATLTANPIK